MPQAKYHGVFRGSATEPQAFFYLAYDAQQFANSKDHMSIKPCLVTWKSAVPCDRCELNDGCIEQPFTDGCKPEWNSQD